MLRTPRPVPPVLAAVLCAASTACVDISAGDTRYIDTVEKRFAVSGTPTLTVGTFDGSVDISTWDRPEVLVVIEKHARDKAAADRMVVESKQEGDRISVGVHPQRDGGFHLNVGWFSAQVTVTVPAQTVVEANTGDGRVSVRDLAGDLSIRTGDGRIQLTNVSGGIDATSGDGSIEIDGVLTRLNARSGDGRMRILARSGAPAADWMVATGDGSIVLEVPDAFAAELDAETGDGRVRVDDLPFADATGEHSRTRARGRIGAGGARVTLRSGDGGITVRRLDAPPQP